MDCEALIRGYDMPPKARQALVGRLLRAMTDEKTTARTLTSITRALMQVERVRLEAARFDADTKETTTEGDPEAALRAMRDDPEYLDYLRERALDADNAGT
jgi:hypothetical protein